MPPTHNLKDLAAAAGGEYVLGMKDLRTHACYLIYGELAPGEAGRKVCPGSGHEEILMAVIGDLKITGWELDLTLKAGEAIHFKEEQTCFLSNPGTEKAVYVLAGGHSGKGH